ncbi:TPA: hypothetical protein QH822_002744 [Klebsiella quasipneumoniae subsp. similipneumoniae]|nr:hypothetical protein [Klebsiella quasipneumoniae subsp. similipneumoniae]
MADDKPVFVIVIAFLPGGGFRLTRPTKNSNIKQLGNSLWARASAAPPGNPDDYILSAVWAALRGGFFMPLRGTNHQNNFSIWPILTLLSR